jgi:hypothetical protein
VSSAPPSTTQPPSFRTIMRGLLPSILISGILPFIIYQLLKSYTSVSDIEALAISAVPAIIYGIVSIVRQRQLDLIAGFTIVGIAVTMIAALVGGDPRLFLIRESFLTVALGIASLVSLLFTRPLWFYIFRYFVSSNDPERTAAFDANWQYALFRSYIRIVTIVWGVTYLGEFILRLILVYNLSIPQFLAVSPFIFYGITIGVIAFTIAYGNRTRRRGEELRRQRQAAAQAQVSTTEAETTETK